MQHSIDAMMAASFVSFHRTIAASRNCGACHEWGGAYQEQANF
jgi:hypothetical protein